MGTGRIAAFSEHVAEFVNVEAVLAGSETGDATGNANTGLVTCFRQIENATHAWLTRQDNTSPNSNRIGWGGLLK